MCIVSLADLRLAILEKPAYILWRTALEATMLVTMLQRQINHA